MKDKIKELLLSKDITNHILALDLAFNTLNMTEDEVINLITWNDVYMIEGKFSSSYGCPNIGYDAPWSYYNKTKAFLFAKKMSREFIKDYKNGKL